MNKGLKAHAYATLLYLIMLFIGWMLGANEMSIEIKYIFILGYGLVQAGIGIICYIDRWYEKD
jgi:hypothetical protein